MSALQQIRAEPSQISAPEAIVAHSLPGSMPRLVVVCAGPGAPSLDVPAPEFVDVAHMKGRAHALFLADPTRSWMNGPGVADAMKEVITAYMLKHKIEEVTTFGQSMGGYAALILADLLPVTHAIAFAPQFSMDPELVPEERRWRGYTDKIADWPFRSVGALSQEATSYLIVHGSNAMEAAHWMRFPHRPEIDHFILAGQAHNIATMLVKRQIMDKVLAQAVERKRRGVRLALEKTFLDRTFIVRRRAQYMEEHPELTLAEGGAPVLIPEVRRD